MIEKALNRIRVLDLTQGIAGPYCTRLLACLGAEVIKIEPPIEGDCGRKMGPFYKNQFHIEGSALFLYLNTSKKSITLDLDSQLGVETLKRQISSADVLVENFQPGVMAAKGLDYRALEKLNPGLVIASVTYFGQTGPYKDYKGNSLIGYALGGQMYMNGEADREPLAIAGQQPEYFGGIHAFNGIIAALLWREKSGLGQYIDVSIMESIAYLHEFAVTAWTHVGVKNLRAGRRLPVGGYPITVYACKEGYVSFCPAMPHQVENLFLMIGRPELVEEPRFETDYSRFQHADEIDRYVEEWIKDYTADEVIELAQELRIPSGKVMGAADLFADEQLKARDYWVELEHPHVGKQLYPGAPFKMSETPWQMDRAPLLGEHNHEISKDGTRDELRKPLPAGDKDVSELPLDGIRVLDLTHGWAGPIGARFLADLGAEVIKIETLLGRGMARVEPPQPLYYPRVCHAAYPNNEPGDEPYNRYGPFNEYHRNKESLTLDLKKEECKGIFKRLVAISDVVMENYSPRVMKNFGLDYPVLKEINPKITMISMPGFGMDGPKKNFVSYGTNIEATAGFTQLTGYPEGAPNIAGEAMPDPNGGMHGIAAVLSALFYRERTGKGQYIDLAQNEAMIGIMGETWLTYAMNGEEPKRMGNKHPYHAPHGVYRCQGEDNWIAIAVTSDEEWKSFCKAMGGPPWCRDPKFASEEGRHENQEKLDSYISEWIAGKDYKEAMHLLQCKGIPAGAVLTNQDICEDPHLKARGYFWDTPHPKAGTLPFPGVSVHLSKAPARLQRHAPLLGEHNEYVLKGLLHMSDDEVRQLMEEKAIGTRPPEEHVGPAYG